MTAEQALEQGSRELGVALSREAQARLMHYIALLAKWNRTYNLTAIRDPIEMVTHHLLDSLAVVPHLPLPVDGTLADVGSGAGLPGVAIAIARPQWQVTLNDSREKKTAFLRQAKIELMLSNVDIHEGRVERWIPQTKFAVVISRAFAELAQFRSLCAHLVAADGFLAAMTGAAAQAPGCRTIELHVPLLSARRHLILCPAQLCHG
jgi:16S rRNA (guanine527-N7)-methyltransferase